MSVFDRGDLFCGSTPVASIRVDNPKKGRTRSQYNDYMKNYMREYRARWDNTPKQSGVPRDRRDRVEHADRSEALFDPLRDPLPSEPETITARVLGDPPRERSALAKRGRPA